jgi:hypothetical protein
MAAMFTTGMLLDQEHVRVALDSNECVAWWHCDQLITDQCLQIQRFECVVYLVQMTAGLADDLLHFKAKVRHPR